MCADTAYAPFGETYAQAGASDVSFTGQNSDSTSGDYDFLYREYSNQGRWASPDPAGLAAVDPTNPQSWNRYAYVDNNPLGDIDPSGMLRYPCQQSAPYCEYWDNYLFQLSDQLEADWLGSGSIPWWSVTSDGRLLYNVATIPTFEPNPFYVPDTQLPDELFNVAGWYYIQDIWVDLGLSPSSSGAPQGMNVFWSLMYAYWNQIPLTLTIYAPIPQTRGIVQAQVPISILPKQGVACAGGGLALGTPSPKYVSAGPLLFGDLNNAQGVLSGWSWNFNAQPSPLRGYQGVVNGSGQLNGPTVATETGYSVGGSLSGCGSYKK